jgi:FAD/FMN-containing dehydrogenase/Fe-S oxidoreductase
MKRKNAFVQQDLINNLQSALQKNSDSEIRFDNGGRALYATDGSNYRYVPIGVVLPRTIEAAVKAIGICKEFDVPIVARGGGTALAGQGCNNAVVIDFSKFLNKVLQIDPKTKTARVQPGTILDDLRYSAQKQFRLTFGPDPATHNHCTLGGMLGNNSCGIHSVMAGRTVDNVKELDVLTYDGIRMKVGRTSEDDLEAAIAGGGRIGEIYSGMKRIRDIYGDIIRKRYPKIPRRVSGYNLDELLPENGFQVARALVGTENTCVTILEATLDLVESPPGRALLVLGYPDVYEAATHIKEILEYKPLGLEGIDELLVDFMKRKKLHVDDLKYLPEGKGWLLVEFGGEDRDDALNNAKKAMGALRKEPKTPNMKLYSNLTEEEHIWEIRESGLGATANVPGMPLAWPGWEDSAVHPDNLSQYLKELRNLFNKYNYIASLYGHFGQACVHCRISFDLISKKGINAYRSFVSEASDLVIKLGGSFSGEHGDGQSRAELLPKMYGPELVKAFEEFKQLWDPRWKMNPGKVVKPNAIVSGLRLGTSYNPWRPETHFKFTHDKGSFARATLRCVGVGKCRRTGNAFMCPSFLVTREEEHTTRGRAHVLFEMFQRDVIGKEGWNTEEVRKALDLCLACKGCKKECPVNVDMAMYKSEFQSHYYRFPRLRPRHAYLMGLIGYLAPVGAQMPGLANFFTQAPVIRNITKAVCGIAQMRSFPKLTAVPFIKWFNRRSLGNVSVEKRVVLFPDTFNNYFYPQTLRAAVAILEHWGYFVVIPQGRIPAVRPLIHYGMLNLAKWEINNILVMIRQEIRDGTPIIFLEPSTVSVFRDEMPQLLPLDRDAQRLTQNSYLISEFIEQENLNLPMINKKAILHGHCHEKAVLDINATRSILQRMGIEYSEPQEGCCGMAGSFGFEANHYKYSEKIGNQYLIPAVKCKDPDTLVIANGFSCRTQILDGSNIMGLHLAEVIARGFNLSYKV